MKYTTKLLLINILLFSAPALQAMGGFKTFGTRFAQAARNFNNKNDLLTKGLKLGTTGLGLVTQYTLCKDAYDAYRQEAQPDRKEIHSQLMLLGEKQQDYLRSRVQHMYPSEKPLYFGVINQGQEKGGNAISCKDANYILLEDPTIQALAERTVTIPKKENETEEEYTQRVNEILGNVQREIHQAVFTYCHTLDPQNFADKAMSVINHEMGHLIGNHAARASTYNKQVQTGAVGAGFVLNAYLIKDTIKASLKKTALLRKFGAIGIMLPAINIGKAYLTSAKKRQYEGEADDYSIAHAESIAQLESERDYFEKEHTHIMHLFEILKQQAQSADTLSHKLFKYNQFYSHKINALYFRSHPSEGERAQKFARAIEQRKSLEKTS